MALTISFCNFIQSPKNRRLENVLALTNDEYDMENVSFIPFQLDAIVMDIITKEEVNVRTLLPT